uniref:Uncharacterized protein n=1 Tax=Rhizophora mucronata TaxID=61149 RepID=A0A2P2N0D8_RHIMU
MLEIVVARVSRVTPKAATVAEIATVR